jgi:uncharacterized protein (DUF305 family)
MEKMKAETMSIKPSGNSDVDFIKLMLPHHQAAIDMTKALTRFRLKEKS